MDKSTLIQIAFMVGGAVLGFGVRAAVSWLRSRGDGRRRRAGDILADANKKVQEARATPDTADDKIAEAAFQEAKAKADKELQAQADLEALASAFETADPAKILNGIKKP